MVRKTRKKVATPEMPQETGGFSYSTAEDMPPDIKEMIYKEWLPRIVAALLKGVKELPPEHRNNVLKEMSKACGPMAVGVCGIDPEMSRSEYIKHMTNLPPPLGPRSIKWIKDIVQVDYKPPKDKRGRPVCQCPMVMLGMIEPFPELCICSANVGASFIEAYTLKPAAKAELIGSIHSGLPSCQYRVYLKPSIASTKRA
jgi:hypothetical protein